MERLVGNSAACTDICRAYRVLERGARGAIALPLRRKAAGFDARRRLTDARVRASPRAQLSSCVARRRGRLPRALRRSHRRPASILVHVSHERRELAFTLALTCVFFLECKSRRVIFAILIVY